MGDVDVFFVDAPQGDDTERIWATTTISFLFYYCFYHSYCYYCITSILLMVLLLLAQIMMMESTNDAAGMLLKRSDKEFMIVDDKDNDLFFKDVSMLKKLDGLLLLLCDGRFYSTSRTKGSRSGDHS